MIDWWRKQCRDWRSMPHETDLFFAIVAMIAIVIAAMLIRFG